MPKELPGFYHDAGMNRYFPYKGPIPVSSSKPPSLPPLSEPKQIKLYDHRGMQRGPVQSYDGNIISHTRIDLGLDPSENVVMSGGEDCYLRLWDIKSGELVFENRCMNSTPSAVSWARIRDSGITGATGRGIVGAHGLII